MSYQRKIIQKDLYLYQGELKGLDRKSTRLNSSHVAISYAVFCLKKKMKMLELTGIAPWMGRVLIVLYAEYVQWTDDGLTDWDPWAQQADGAVLSVMPVCAYAIRQ